MDVEKIVALLNARDLRGFEAQWTTLQTNLLKLKDDDERCFWHWTASLDAAGPLDYAWSHADLSTALPIDHKDEAGWTALHVAAACASETVARQLLHYGANPREELHNGNTALHLASSKGSLPICQALLEAVHDKSAFVGHANQYGMTALARALGNGRIRVAEWLRANGASLKDRSTVSGDTLLHQAVVSVFAACVSIGMQIDRELVSIKFLLTYAPELAVVENNVRNFVPSKSGYNTQVGRDALSYGDGSVRAVFTEFFDEKDAN